MVSVWLQLGGLYRGVKAPLGGVALVNAVVFGVYGNAQRTLGTEQLSAHFLAGCAAGLSQSFILGPLELAKTRLQVSDRYRGSWDVLRSVLKAEGVRGLSRGLGLTVAREVPSYGTYFATYELLTGSQVPHTLTVSSHGTGLSLLRPSRYLETLHQSIFC